MMIYTIWRFKSYITYLHIPIVLVRPMIHVLVQHEFLILQMSSFGIIKTEYTAPLLA